MEYFNYHTHSVYCDGKGTLEENIISAIKNGIADLGFSSHAPLDFNPKWTMREERFQEYMSEIRFLAEKYSGKIRLFAGLEVDFIPGIYGPAAAASRKLDYTIGAVHVLGKPDDGSLVAITGNSALFEKNVRSGFGGDIVSAVKEYYRLVREMLLSEPPDIIAHIDLIKKVNVDYSLFDETSAWYMNEIFETLEAVKKSGAITEINTGALTRKKAKELFPSETILNELAAGDMPVTINSDSHSPHDIAGLYSETIALMRKTGFRSVKRLVLPGGWSDYEIS